MKNRTVLGIICMVLAIITVFAVSPIVNRLTNGETTVLRISEDIKRGAKITQKDIEIPKESVDELFKEIRQITQQDRTLFKKSQAAFVSFCKGYGEHQCKYIFNLKKMNFSDIATGMCLLKMPGHTKFLRRRNRLTASPWLSENSRSSLWICPADA